MSEQKYTISPQTEKLLDVIKAYDEVGEMFADTVDEIYSDSDKVIDEYFEAAQRARNYLISLVTKNICYNVHIMKTEI